MSAFASLPSSRPTGLTTRSGAGARLIVDTPLLAVLETMDADLSRLRRLEPNSGACHALEDYYRRLASAIEEAVTADVWVSTQEAARLRGLKSTAAITRLCREGKLRCQKRGGVWEIHKDSVLADTRRAPKAA